MGVFSIYCTVAENGKDKQWKEGDTNVQVCIRRETHTEMKTEESLVVLMGFEQVCLIEALIDMYKRTHCAC